MSRVQIRHIFEICVHILLKTHKLFRAFDIILPLFRHGKGIVLLSNIWQPILASAFLTMALTADWLTNSFCAAFEKLFS